MQSTNRDLEPTPSTPTDHDDDLTSHDDADAADDDDCSSSIRHHRAHRGRLHGTHARDARRRDDDDDDGARRIVMRAHRWRMDDAIRARAATPPRARAVDRGTVRARA